MSKLIVLVDNKPRPTDNLDAQSFFDLWGEFFGEQIRVVGSDRYQLDLEHERGKAHDKG